MDRLKMLIAVAGSRDDVMAALDEIVLVYGLDIAVSDETIRSAWERMFPEDSIEEKLSRCA